MDFSSLGGSSRVGDGLGSTQGSGSSAVLGSGVRVPQGRSRILEFSNLGGASVLDTGLGTSQAFGSSHGNLLRDS